MKSVMMIEGSFKKPPKDDNQQIKFSPFDTDIVEDNGNDLIAISVVISTFLVERILVDDGSVVEVLMWKAFKEMGLDESQLRPTRLIYDFSNPLIKAKGIIMLLIMLGHGSLL